MKRLLAILATIASPFVIVISATLVCTVCLFGVVSGIYRFMLDCVDDITGSKC